MEKINLILKHFLEKFPRISQVNERYINLYKEYSTDWINVFSYLHQEINKLIEFLNSKNEHNKHYNADPSRDFINILNNLDDLKKDLNIYGEEIIINEYYKNIFIELRKFLSTSGGSHIPDNFERINIINYEPIFSLSNKKIVIKDNKYLVDLISIGEGAFSLVSKYKDSTYDKFYVIKTLKKSSTERELERFKKEFEILKRINFPYIVEVYSYDEIKNSYVMEYCEGTLKKYITKNNNQLSFSTRKRICLQFLYAINYIHSKNILHRDISYNNILLKEYDDNVVLIKLSDFGLIKESKSEFTKTDTDIKGTIIDPSLDSFKNYNILNEIYSIGFIINFIFTGKQSFSPTETNISKIIEKCIDVKKENRYESVEKIIAKIELLEKIIL